MSKTITELHADDVNSLLGLLKVFDFLLAIHSCLHQPSESQRTWSLLCPGASISHTVKTKGFVTACNAPHNRAFCYPPLSPLLSLLLPHTPNWYLTCQRIFCAPAFPFACGALPLGVHQARFFKSLLKHYHSVRSATSTLFKIPALLSTLSLPYPI